MFWDKRLQAEAWQVRRPLMAAAGLSFGAGLLTIGQAACLARAIAGIFLGGFGPAEVAPWLAGFLGFALGRSLLGWVAEDQAHAAAQTLKQAIRLRLLEHLWRLGPIRMRAEQSGEVAGTLLDGVEALEAYFSQFLPQLAVSITVPLAIVLFIFPRDILSAVVLLVTAPLVPFFLMLVGSLSEAATRGQWDELSKLSARYLDLLRGLPTLKLFGRNEQVRATLRDDNERYRQATLTVLRITFLSALVLELVSTLSTAVVAVEIGLRVLYGRLAFEPAFFVLILAPELYLPLRTLGLRFHAATSGVVAADRIFGLLGQADGKSDADASMPGSADTGQAEVAAAPAVDAQRTRHIVNVRAVPHGGPTVELAGVTYRYPGAAGDTLHAVSFAIEPGRITGLLGPSGAGKSTIAALLLRFIEPDSGQVRVDGAAGQQIDPVVWRTDVAWVPQAPHLFAGSVLDNVALARPGARPDEVMAAARLAGAHDFFQGLPEGYATRLGDGGMRLSGGEAQRLALARAFLKDAPLLLLDEPTANLDPQNQRLVIDAVRRLAAGRTTLLISHRPAELALANQIVTLEAGRVTGVGTHSQLLSGSPLYRNWWQLQFGQSACDRMPVASQAVFGSANRVPTWPTAAKEPVDFATPPPEKSARTAGRRPGALRFLLTALGGSAWSMVLAGALGSGTIASSVGLMGVSAWIIAYAALGPSIAELQVAIVAVRFFGLSRGVLRYLERLATHGVTLRVLAKLRAWFYGAIEPLAPAGLPDVHGGDLWNAMLGDVQVLENFYVRVLAPPVVAALVSGCALFGLRAAHPTLASAALPWLIVGGVGVPCLAYWAAKRPARTGAAARADLARWLVDGLSGMADLLVCGQGMEQLAVVAQASRSWGRIQRRWQRIVSAGDGLTAFLSAGSVAAVVWTGTPLVRADALSGVWIAAQALGLRAAWESLEPLPAAARALQTSLAAAGRLLDLSGAGGEAQACTADGGRARPEFGAGESESVAGESGASESGYPNAAAGMSIEVVDLHFRYRAEEPLALDSVSFAVPAGGRLLVVGPSGSGKSTLVNLLVRFWQAPRGTLWLGGRDVTQVRGDWVRSQVAVVAQRTQLFSASVRENLLMARPDAEDADLWEALANVGLAERVRRLPEGLDDWLGDQGWQLSGGERQRLAVARALLKRSPVLLLDEPTAHLDPQTERDLLRALDQLVPAPTILFVTHHLNLVQNTDQVVVLQGGRITQMGSGRELAAQPGWFSEACWVQDAGLATRRCS
jgi:ATP-binding cassette, subfamily C, bacterial CydCD